MKSGDDGHLALHYTLFHTTAVLSKRRIARLHERQFFFNFLFGPAFFTCTTTAGMLV